MMKMSKKRQRMMIKTRNRASKTPTPPTTAGAVLAAVGQEKMKKRQIVMSPKTSRKRTRGIMLKLRTKPGKKYLKERLN